MVDSKALKVGDRVISPYWLWEEKVIDVLTEVVKVREHGVTVSIVSPPLRYGRRQRFYKHSSSHWKKARLVKT